VSAHPNKTKACAQLHKNAFSWEFLKCKIFWFSLGYIFSLGLVIPDVFPAKMFRWKSTFTVFPPHLPTIKI
jgi:hypothetical protein